MKHDPWNDSHAPKNFERTDKSGRWSPIEDDYFEEPEWLPIVGGILAGLIFAFVFWVGML